MKWYFTVVLSCISLVISSLFIFINTSSWWPVWERKSLPHCLYLWGKWGRQCSDVCWEWKVEGREAPCDYYVQYSHLRRPVFKVCTTEQMILLKWRPPGLKEQQLFGWDFPKEACCGPTLYNPSCLSVMCGHKCPSFLRTAIVVIGYGSLSPSSFPFLGRKSPRHLAKGFPRSLNYPHYLISPLETIYTPPPLPHPLGLCVGCLYFDKKEKELRISWAWHFASHYAVDENICR